MKRLGIIFFAILFFRSLIAWAAVDSEISQGPSREELIIQTLENFERQANERDLKIQRELERYEQKIDDLEEQLSEKQIQNPDEEYTEETPQDYEQYPAEEGSFTRTMVIQGNTRFEVAHHIYSPSEFSKIKSQLSLTGRGELAPALRYRISGRTYYDAVYDTANYYSGSATSDQRFEMQLRDTYFDYSAGPWDLRLGKQQVVWGEAVGVFVADVVNAKDLRELTLSDFDSIRIPEWGANLEYTQNNFHSEFVVLPGIEFNKFGVSGSEFTYPLPIVEGTPFTYHDAKTPKMSLENSKFGARFNYLWEGFDTGVFYLHSWTQSPVLYRSISVGVYDFDPQYKRLDTFGATISKEIHDIVLKGDFVYTKDDFYPVFDVSDADGIVRSGHLEYLLGADYTFFDKIDANVQFIQNVISKHTSSMVNVDKYNNSISLRLSRDFFNRKLQAEFLVIYGLNAPDFLYQPKLKYSLTDNWQASVGADIFSGNSSGSFGLFRSKSRWYSELTYKF